MIKVEISYKYYEKPGSQLIQEISKALEEVRKQDDYLFKTRDVEMVIKIE